MGQPSPGVRLSRRSVAAIGRPPANPARDAEIVRRRLAGERTVDLAAEFGIHQSRIAQIVAASKRPPQPPKQRKPGANVARDAEIARRRLAGESPSALAAEFGLHPSRIPQIVRTATAVQETA